MRNNIILILVLAAALFLRTVRLDYVELFGDELDAGYQAYSLMTTGSDYKGNFMPAYIQSFSEWRAPGLIYGMIPFIKIFGLNEWGVRVGPAVFGVIGIFLFYKIILQLGFKKKIGLITAAILAITPWNIQYSRAGFEVTLMSALLFAGLLFLIKGIKNNNNWRIVASGIFLGAAIYTYNTANIFVPLISIVTLWSFTAFKKQWMVLIVTGMILCLPLGRELIFGHAGERFGTLSIMNNKNVVAEINDYRNAGGNSLWSKIFYNKATISIKKVLFNYSNAYGSNFLFREGDVTFRHSLHQVGNLFWIELPLIIWGAINLLKYKNNGKKEWIWLLLLISPIPASLTIDGYNHATRLFVLVFPLSLLTAVGFDNLKKYWKILVIVVFIFEFGFFQYYYWNFYRNESWRWWHTGYKEAMLYVKDNKDKYDTVYINNTYEPALIRYLFWNQIDAKKVFSLKDNGNFCLEDVCFSDNNNLKLDNLVPKSLYLISQEKNVGGDWDLNKSTPNNMIVLKTIRNYYDQPIFYLVKTDKTFDWTK